MCGGRGKSGCWVDNGCCDVSNRQRSLVYGIRSSVLRDGGKCFWFWKTDVEQGTAADGPPKTKTLNPKP